MSLEDAVALFEKEGYHSHESALVESKRGTSDLTYLYYTLGKLQIMKLRDDMREKQGAGVSLQQFHDAFLSPGFPAIKIVREALLANDSPPLWPGEMRSRRFGRKVVPTLVTITDGSLVI